VLDIDRTMVCTSVRALCACHRIRRSQAGRTLRPMASVP
jgi:hypothetical protein